MKNFNMLTVKRFKKYWQLFILVLPAMIYTAVFSYGPMYGIIIAFKNYKPKLGYWGSDWVGLKHFIRFVTYPEFGEMLLNTLSISLYSLATFPCAIILALLINEIKSNAFKKTVQMVTYAPYFLSTVVLCGIVSLFVGREGPIGLLYTTITGKSENLLAIPEFFNDIYVWSGVWQGTGWGTIVYLAALAGVSSELIESAKIDGATRLQIIRHVELPCIMPTIIVMLIMRTGNILSVGFEKILVLQNVLNLSASKVISTYVYEIGLAGGQFSYSTAIGLFNNIINITMILIVNKVSKKLTGMGMW